MSYDGPIWEGVYHNFSEVPAEGPGFDGQEWIGNSLKKMQALRDEAEINAPLPPPGNYREGLLPLLAALVYREQKKLRILDFGGGIGFTYYQTMQALPRTEGFEYHIVEREAVCKAGKEFFRGKNGNLFFQPELPKSNVSFDIIHVSSALHYIEDWKDLLTELCAFSPKYLLLVDVVAGNIPTFVTAQNYYDSRIPVWFFNIDEFIRAIDAHGFELIFKSAFLPTIQSVEQHLPMQNFEEKYRLQNTCNLLFASRITNND